MHVIDTTYMILEQLNICKRMQNNFINRLVRIIVEQKLLQSLIINSYYIIQYDIHCIVLNILLKHNKCIALHLPSYEMYLMRS